MLTNVLNLAALAAGVTLAMLGVRVLARRLRALADAAEMACGHCGNPVSTLTDFTCPACRQDVRASGLSVGGPAREPAGGRQARAAVAWTVIVLILACAVTVGVGTRVSGYVAEREAERSWFDAKPLARVAVVRVYSAHGVA